MITMKKAAHQGTHLYQKPWNPPVHPGLLETWDHRLSSPAETGGGGVGGLMEVKAVRVLGLKWPPAWRSSLVCKTFHLYDLSCMSRCDCLWCDLTVDVIFVICHFLFLCVLVYWSLNLFSDLFLWISQFYCSMPVLVGCWPFILVPSSCEVLRKPVDLVSPRRDAVLAQQ